MRPISHCLNAELLQLCRQALDREEMTEILRTHLPSALAPHCEVSSYEKGCLHLFVLPAWVTALRFELPQLRDSLRKKSQWYQLLSIKITVSSS